MTSSDDVLVTKQADVLSAEELASAYQRWEAPRMVSVSDLSGTGNTMLTVNSMESLQQQAQSEGYTAGYEQGYKAGFQAGSEAGEREVNQQIGFLKQILTTLNQPLQEMDQQVETDLVNLATTMTRQLVRREMKIEPEHVIGAMRAALAVLPISDRKIKVFLHPQDVALVKKGLAMEQDDQKWQWLEDPLMGRGDVKIETADTIVNATVEARLNSVINKMLGEERHDAESG